MLYFLSTWKFIIFISWKIIVTVNHSIYFPQQIFVCSWTRNMTISKMARKSLRRRLYVVFLTTLVNKRWGRTFCKPLTVLCDVWNRKSYCVHKVSFFHFLFNIKLTSLITDALPCNEKPRLTLVSRKNTFHVQNPCKKIAQHLCQCSQECRTFLNTMKT